jgi:two-component system, chemotaxis family, protein-glutamate methylesterase/glutaminase
VGLCRTLRPDVITLDMVLPTVDGLQVTEQVMAQCPTPILIVSASTNRGELYRTYDALNAGALDVLDKPGSRDTGTAWEVRLVAAVRMVARIKVITHLKGRYSARPAVAAPAFTPPAESASRARRCQLIALGASTGGPSALVAVLRELPDGLPLSILLVLHIDEPFGTAFAEWLTDQTQHPVSFARGGELLATRDCRVLMAPPGRHLIVDGDYLRLDDGPERHSCRPSIDVLFESLARHAGARSAAALLTGMGRDGASGLLALRQAGALTVAQDEASSIVYGMPREAALIGAASHVLPLRDIGRFLAASITRRPGAHDR